MQKERSYLVTEIEFDYDEENVPYDEQIFIRDNALGVWFAFDEEHLIDKISDTCGYLIREIEYGDNRPHALTSFM